MNKAAALYARVSSDRQKENHTIASQVAALIQYAETNGYLVPPEWQFQDDGYSGATLVRPGLEALRDLAAEGQIQTVLIYSPDRLSRKYAYQVLLAEELARCGGVRGRGGPFHLRCLYAARPQPWCHRRLTQPTRGADADATEPMGTPHPLEDAA
jgi:hypothetical protein